MWRTARNFPVTCLLACLFVSRCRRCHCHFYFLFLFFLSFVKYLGERGEWEWGSTVVMWVVFCDFFLFFSFFDDTRLLILCRYPLNLPFYLLHTSSDDGQILYALVFLRGGGGGVG
ncbi:hypothetical protein BZA05DRAFT_90529 [Tricharina praecox]|uniref:uncharacterized protein n=1 Tax=Tricharina praecox TaxID=43433 RepID=UPI002220287F|nr:uncharacterized protein BZA05DRAFT_90529 [Tricharina praecox]KAI5848930.1 hypothetical protein BZA05DRAFT_90529 [Tricharina praecox]